MSDTRHPLLARKAALRKQGVGIVYAADGSPRISPDWVAHLTPEQRQWADQELAARGYRINESNEAERI